MIEIISPKDVAEFMKAQFNQKLHLYQEEIVYEIENRFGPDFVYTNENGNTAINPKVLKAFREITPNLVRERGERYWRLRAEFDDPKSRMQE